MTWQEAEAHIQQKYGWSDQKVQYAESYYEASQPDGAQDPGPDGFVEAFVTGDGVQAWLAGFNGWLPAEINDNKVHAEQIYNAMTGGTPMVPGTQYVQDNGDGSFMVVVTYTDLQKAEADYNMAANNQPFVVGKRYVQNDFDGTYKVVVRFPMDY